MSVALSRQSEKFLIGQSRKFLLTAERLKDGTNRDEPRGTRLAGMAKASARQEDDAARGGRADGSQPALGAQAVETDETRGGPGRSAWAARSGVEPQDLGTGSEPSHRDSEATRLARFWTDVRQRAVSQAARHRTQRRDTARVDDRSRVVEEPHAPQRGRALLATTAERLW
jgi:hypothetical protein